MSRALAAASGMLRAAVVAGLLVAAGAAGRGTLHIPDRLNPWAELQVREAPGWWTRLKLQRAQADPAACIRALDGGGLDYKALADRPLDDGCGWQAAVSLRSAGTARLGKPAVLSCPAALSLAMWERHALQPAAHAALGQSVAAIEHLGSYACRNVNTGSGPAAHGRRSRHATADAIDVSAFVLGNGRRVRVGQAPSDAARELQFLELAHEGACRFFDGVLGPAYNAAHADHFHLERGGWGSCR